MSRAVAAAGPSRGNGAGGRSSSMSRGPVLRYFQRAELPLTSLVFLLPFMVVYELGTRLISGVPVHAFTLLRRFFDLFGATGAYLPALAVVGILLAWHIARRDPWQVDVSTLIGMLFESASLAIPLIAMNFVAVRYLALSAPASASSAARGMLVLSLGAGIYEELVFRLILFTALHALFFDVMGMRKFYGYLLIVASSSVLFAQYHYWAGEPFLWRTFVFRVLGGTYFGALFVLRGFGITAGTHAAYDLIIVLLRTCAAG